MRHGAGNRRWLLAFSPTLRVPGSESFDYLARYNTQRPHYSLDNRTPCQMLAQYLPDESRMYWARTGIVLTGPELDKPGQLGRRVRLYVVAHCKSERPRLRVVQDPVSKLSPEMLYRQIQYPVEEFDRAGHGKEVDPPTDIGVRRE